MSLNCEAMRNDKDTIMMTLKLSYFWSLVFAGGLHQNKKVNQIKLANKQQHLVHKMEWATDNREKIKRK